MCSVPHKSRSSGWLHPIDGQAPGRAPTLLTNPPEIWTVRLEGSECRTAEQLFQSAARALDFPRYFGANWAAFDECLSDLLDLTEGGMGSKFGDRKGRQVGALRVIFNDADQLLSADPIESLRVLVSILRDNAQVRNRYTDQEVNFAELDVYLLSTSGRMGSVLTRFHRAGVLQRDCAG